MENVYLKDEEITVIIKQGTLIGIGSEYQRMEWAQNCTVSSTVFCFGY